MSGLIIKVKVWAKGLALGFAVLYTLFFLLNNSKTEAVWVWFGYTFQIPLPLLIIGSFLAGVVLTLLVRTLLGTVRQFRDVQKQSRQVQMEKDLQDMKAKADMLKTKDGA